MISIFVSAAILSLSALFCSAMVFANIQVHRQMFRSLSETGS